MAADEGSINSMEQNNSVAPSIQNVPRFRYEECKCDFETQEARGMHNSPKHQISKEPKKVNSRIILGILGIIAVVVFAGYFIYFNNSPATGATIFSEPENDAQKITLSFKEFNYFPDSITVKAGIPVEITLDQSIGGCFRSFTIKDLGVRAYSGNPNEKIKFTPSQKGTFEFACEMRMGMGTINVI